MAAAAVC
jgi:hypothetical protein